VGCQGSPTAKAGQGQAFDQREVLHWGCTLGHRYSILGISELGSFFFFLS
jgi:hypothetical protein